MTDELLAYSLGQDERNTAYVDSADQNLTDGTAAMRRREGCGFFDKMVAGPAWSKANRLRQGLYASLCHKAVESQFAAEDNWTPVGWGWIPLVRDGAWQRRPCGCAGVTKVYEKRRHRAGAARSRCARADVVSLNRAFRLRKIDRLAA